MIFLFLVSRLGYWPRSTAHEWPLSQANRASWGRGKKRITIRFVLSYQQSKVWSKDENANVTNVRNFNPLFFSEEPLNILPPSAKFLQRRIEFRLPNQPLWDGLHGLGLRHPIEPIRNRAVRNLHTPLVILELFIAKTWPIQPRKNSLRRPLLLVTDDIGLAIPKTNPGIPGFISNPNPGI